MFFQNEDDIHIQRSRHNSERVRHISEAESKFLSNDGTFAEKRSRHVSGGSNIRVSINHLTDEDKNE